MAVAGLPSVSKRLFDAIVGFCFEDFLCWYAPLTVVLWLLISWADTKVPTVERWSVQEMRALSAHVTVFVWSWLLVAIYHYLNGCEWTRKYRILVGESGDELRKDHGLPRHVEVDFLGHSSELFQKSGHLLCGLLLCMRLLCRAPGTHWESFLGRSRLLPLAWSHADRNGSAAGAL